MRVGCWDATVNEWESCGGEKEGSGVLETSSIVYLQRREVEGRKRTVAGVEVEAIVPPCFRSLTKNSS